MSAVAIVGAGSLGGTLAHALARRDRVGEIRLIDSAGQIAAGKALDILQSGPVEGFDARVRGFTDLSSVIGAKTIVLADAAPQGAEWQGESGLATLKRIRELASAAVIVCAGASQRTLMEQGWRELGIPREQIIGSAPIAYAGAIRAMVALSLDESPSDLSLTVLGVPPKYTVVPWSEVTLAGLSVTNRLTPPQITRLEDRAMKLWPPGPHALAAAAAGVVEAVTLGSRRTFSCFVVLDGALGPNGLVSATPVRLGTTGIQRVVLPSLTTHERTRLENAWK